MCSRFASRSSFPSGNVLWLELCMFRITLLPPHPASTTTTFTLATRLRSHLTLLACNTTGLLAKRSSQAFSRLYSNMFRAAQTLGLAARQARLGSTVSALPVALHGYTRRRVSFTMSRLVSSCAFCSARTYERQKSHQPASCDTRAFLTCCAVGLVPLLQASHTTAWQQSMRSMR